MKYQSTREQLLAAVLKAQEVDLVRLSAGNVSTRVGDGLIAITPSGIKYNTMTPEDISIVDMEGNLIEGLKPSSETPMHTAIYRNLPDVGSIYHTHSTFAMTFAMLGDDIPMANLELLVCGAPIPVAPWACPATTTAGEVAVGIFNARPKLQVVLLRKHGLVAIGADLDHAFDMAFDAEVGLQSYYQARLLGQPEAITAEEYAEIKAVYHL